MSERDFIFLFSLKDNQFLIDNQKIDTLYLNDNEKGKKKLIIKTKIMNIKIKNAVIIKNNQAIK